MVRRIFEQLLRNCSKITCDEISLVMMINKMQTKEDIEAFRMLPADDIRTIVKNSPGQLIDIIADVLLAFLLKINVPVSEAELLTDKVRKKKMAELFADMDKMDIQAERRNTEEQRQRAETAEQKAEAAEQKAEVSIALLIESYHDAGMSRSIAQQKLMEKLGLDENEAKSKIERHWNGLAE